MTRSPIDWSSIRSAAHLRLAMPRAPLRGRTGERLGAGLGASLEFEDYRPYGPGDDLRHVDWAAYARTQLLAVRLYRDEVAPRVDVVLDTSRSMAVTDEKRRAHADLSGLLACACAATVAETRVITASAREPMALHAPEDLDRVFACDARASALEGGQLPFRRGSVRLVVSDFLFPHDPDALLARIARDCAWLAIVQLVASEEAEPMPEGGRRLVDIEGGGELDLVIDDETVRDYRARFARLRLGLSKAARRVGAPFVYIVAGTPIREVARALAAAGVVEAR